MRKSGAARNCNPKKARNAALALKVVAEEMKLILRNQKRFNIQIS